VQSVSDPVRVSRDAVQVFPSLDDLLAEVTSREPFLTSDSKSGSRFERARYAGEAMVLKYVSLDDDWIMRGTGDVDCRAARFLSSHAAERLPASIDHATVAVAPNISRHGHHGAVLLLHDVATLLVPPGDTCIELDQHLRFIDHMAELQATFWGWHGDIELMPMAHHYTFLNTAMADLEAGRGGADPVPQAVAAGWRALDAAAPAVAPALRALAVDPGPLIDALGATPHTFVHGDWKLGNLGEHPDGRTILLDWDRVGIAPATVELAWYLAVNCRRLPQSKEATIAAYRSALEARGIDTSAWWDRQLSLTLLGAALQLGWDKAGDPEELGWWGDRIVEGMGRLG
jgi:hypothetical protein